MVENKSDDLTSKLTVRDLTGNVIFSKVIVNNQSNELNLQNVENGIYLIEVNNTNNIAHSKITIAK